MAADPTPRPSQGADAAVVIGLAAFVALYLFDAVRASTALLHLVLVLPVSVTVLVLCLLQLVGTLARPVAAPAPRAEPEPVADVAIVTGLFGAYVLSLDWLGFDVGTCLFLAAFLWLHGERRLRWLAAYSMTSGFGLALAFSALLPYAMPMRILPGGAS